jgi:hypothetical protein
MDVRKRFPKYRKLLYLYPAAYRQHYSEQMLQTLADMLDDSSSSQQKLAIWSRTMLDLPLSAVKQQLSYTGEAMTKQTPTYVKNSALLGAAMLLPFFLILAATSIDNNLRSGVLWHYHVLFTFFVLLPALAFLLAAVALVSWLVERHHEEHKSWFSGLIDLRRNWHLFAVLIIGLGIVGMVYGHDSVHCVTGNPIREARNSHQTWRCIEQR